MKLKLFLVIAALLFIVVLAFGGEWKQRESGGGTILDESADKAPDDYQDSYSTKPVRNDITRRPSETVWFGHPVIVVNDGESSTFLPRVELGLRPDGVVIWRDTKQKPLDIVPLEEK